MTDLSILAAALEAPLRLALITETARFTYGELAELCSSRAAALSDARGPVLLQPQLNLDSLLWLYAAAATGVPFLAIHPHATRAERAMLQVLTAAQELPPLPRWPAPQSKDRHIDPEADFCLMPTSGSTGIPKVVVLSRRAVLASAAASESNLGVETDERWLLCLPLSHVAGLSIIVRMLSARRTVVLFEPSVAGLLACVEELACQIHEHRVTIVSLVPTLLERLLRTGFQPPPTLRAVLVGGAGCTPDLAERARHAGIPLLTSYGLTETGSQITARRYAERDRPLEQHSGCASSGLPLASVKIKLVGGRIAIQSPSLFSGYVGAAAPSVDADGWFITTDRGVIGSTGDIYVLGRTDLCIVTGGENVDPEEVERALRLLPEVRDACVFGRPSEEFGQQVVAVVVPAETSTNVTLEGVTHQLRVQLARFKHPRAILIADALPITVSGKLDRVTCIAQFETRF